MPAMTSSFRSTGELLNQRHAHTHTYTHTHFVLFCYTGVMSQSSHTSFSSSPDRKLGRGKVRNSEKQRNKSLIIMVYVSFHSTLLNPLLQTHTPQFMQLPFAHHPVPINSDENFKWDFQSKSHMLGGLYDWT